MVLRQTALIVAAGLVLGIGLALAATRVIASLLYDLDPHDPATLIWAVLVLFGASIAAAWIPAHRASLVDPMVALRHE
jgi:ABC-type antimicrobial peptide transport system permease subunit